MTMPRPILWSIAGLDTAGGAGLSADQRAADAMGVHLCPVVAALTAQHSLGVQAVQPTEAAWLEAQLHALADDLPPHVIKTGLLGSVAAIHTVARWVDRLRTARPEQEPALVIDPVLGASAGGHPLSDDAMLAAYRQELLPRATLITPNRAEARRLLGQDASHDGPDQEIPELAAALRRLGAHSVVITGGDASHRMGSPHCLDWIDTPQAQGWLCGPRVPTRHHHGSGCTFATGAAAALALGHGPADALVLAHMLTHHALQQGYAAGRGAGPVQAQASFLAGARQSGAPLPWLGLGRDLPWQLTHGQPEGDTPAPWAPLFRPFTPPDNGLYGIVDCGERIAPALAAGLRCVQLRHKVSATTPARLDLHLQHGLAAAAQVGATLFINDHWREALALRAPATAHPDLALGLHLGQDDLLALSPTDRATLLAARDRIQLGLSSHSLWELARAAGCGASAIACGPVQATTTKDMPWMPQGADNLRWWITHSPAPVLAIGGLLTPADLSRFAACRPAALCIVRALDVPPERLTQTVQCLSEAVGAGHRQPLPPPPGMPHPVL